jgi:signal transduction histidine kinase
MWYIKDPLSNDSLHTLQAGILGHEAFGLGLRWIVGSGIYVDDVQVEFHRQLIQTFVILVTIALLVSALIQGMIERLQGNSEAAGNVINSSSEAAHQTVEQARQTGESLHQIIRSLRNLTELNASIASATL